MLGDVWVPYRGGGWGVKDKFIESANSADVMEPQQNDNPEKKLSFSDC